VLEWIAVSGLIQVHRGPRPQGAPAQPLRRGFIVLADPWVIGLRRRRPPLVVAVALANKTARIAWAVMLREKEYQPRAVAA
jgi:transposase